MPWAVVTFVLGAMVAISTWELPMGVLVVALLAGRAIPLTPLFSRERAAPRGCGSSCMLDRASSCSSCRSISTSMPPLVKPGPNEPCIGSACFTIAQTSLAQFLTVFGLLLFPPAVLVVSRGTPCSCRAAAARGGTCCYAVVGLAIVIAAFAGNAVLPLLAVLAGRRPRWSPTATATSPSAPASCSIVAGCAALLACEVVFLKDSYGEKLYRMNTVFKLYFQAWTMLAIAAPWALGRLLARDWEWKPTRARLTGVDGGAGRDVGLLSARHHPRPHATAPWKTLDGNAYLRREHPDDFAAIDWLRDNVPDQTVILEATGNPYSYFARFASNTGLPTVLGWANHEGLWRGHDTTVMARRDDVMRIYNAPDARGREPGARHATACATSSSATSSARSIQRAWRSSAAAGRVPAAADDGLPALRAVSVKGLGLR